MIRTHDGTLLLTGDAYWDKGKEVSLYKSRDNGKTWTSVGRVDAKDDIRPGGKGSRHAGVHAPVVELADGRLMTFGRPHPWKKQGDVFGRKGLLSFSSDQGENWAYEASEFPDVTVMQRPAMIRLREGVILLCSFTDQWIDFGKGKGQGMTFKSKDGEFTGYGLFAAVSYDEGKTWPDRRLITPGGPARKVNTSHGGRFTLSDTMAEPFGYLSVTQSRDNRIQLITSKNHYVFNLAWLKPLPPAPNQK